MQVTVNGLPAQVNNRSYNINGLPLDLGSNTLRLIATDRSGNSATQSLNITRKAPSQTQIKKISGDQQTAPISSPLNNPLIVQIQKDGLPVPNIPVIFKVTDNDGLLQSGNTPPASDTPASLIIVNTDPQGQAQARLTLGSRAGAGNNGVQAYSTAADGIILFNASGTPKPAALISVDSGNNQFGAIGQTLVLPFVAVVTDSGYNRLPGVPVSFTVKQGGGHFQDNSGTPVTTLNTTSDSDGRVLASLTLGSQPGQDNNRIEASVGADTTTSTSPPAVFSASAKIPADPAQTRISGIVLDNSNNPIPGVTMRLYQANLGLRNNVHIEVATPVSTDAKGYFNMAPVPVGLYKLMADGNTASSTNNIYPTLEYDIVTVSGQDNNVGMPIYLPALDPLAKLCVDPYSGGTLTIPSAPGFSLTLQPGAATFPGGAKSGCITVTPVNPDKVPMTPGFGQQPRYVITIQPVGTSFNPPAAITIPNMDGLAPRARTEMYSYDHDLAAFVAIGSATVSADGSVIAL